MFSTAAEGSRIAAPWPSAEGEMGRRIRSTNWSSTTLGPAEQWPASLRTTVDLVLDSPLIMLVAWGPEHFLFYNDRARQALDPPGAPAVLGGPPWETLPEVWRRIITLLQAAGRSQHGTMDELELPLNRKPDGDHRFSISCSPVRGDDGLIGGMLAILTPATARQESEAALRRSEERFATFMNHLPGLAWLKDGEGRYVFVNDAAERAFRRGRSELYGHSDAELFPTETAAQFRQNDRLALENSAGVNAIEQLEQEDGIHYSMVSKFAVPDPQGGPEWVGGIAIDITARLKAERALRESDNRFTALALNAPVAIFVKDLSGRYTLANAVACAALGRTDSVVGLTDHELMPPELADRLRLRDLEVVSSGGVVQGEEVVETRGLRREFLSVKFPLRDALGEISGVCGVALEITEHKRAQAAASQLEQRYRQLVHSLPIAIYTCDAAGRIQLYNQAAVDLWGCAPEVGSDRWCGSHRILRPDGTPVPLEQCPMAVAMRERRAILGEEILVERPDGSRRSALVYPCPMFDTAGQLIGAVKMMVDITDRKHAEEELRKAKESAETANQSKDRFLAILSHELRTPLTPVLIAASALERNPALPQSIRDDGRMIRESIRLETSLIDDLLDLSRIVSGTLRLRPEPVDLNEVVLHVCGNCRPLIQRKDIHLHCRLDEELGMVHGDTTRLQQLFWNVIRNAIQFTPAGGDIHVRTHATGAGQSRITVRDNGIGIASALLPRVFEAFEQGDSGNKRRSSGLGIGLAISKALVELHGGSISVQSEGPDKGTLLTIDLPAEPASRPAAEADAADIAGEPPVKARLLLVEDDRGSAEILARVLKSSGYQVCLADSAASALEWVARETFDVILSDIGLPDSSGDELIKRIRERYPVKGIAISGFDPGPKTAPERDAGFEHHLVKPIDIAELERILSRILSAARGAAPS